MWLCVSRVERLAHDAIPVKGTLNLHRWRRLHRDECGGAYTLSYVMVIPFLMLIICLIVESCLMLSAKLGTVYAAYAGARAASVWSSATDWNQAQDRIEKAAIQAMVPFASGSASNSGSPPEFAEEYQTAYDSWATNPVSANYVRSKLANAASQLTVRVVDRPARWDSDIEVKVKYNFPFHVPGVGQLLGQASGSGGYVFPLTSTAIVPNDGPQNATQDLGIGYGKQQ